ncbi:hypothetical protein Q1695_010497 [Nippostrongylus brasiliensis]|nr:hypothetical protein Q1695_010497 [Nippostrongylus brasiliensis]
MKSALFTLLFLAALIAAILAEESNRAKRSYYGYDYGYGADGDFWYAGRILGIILGISMLLLCCCLPCVCLAGVWFLGWFGLRKRQQRKAAANASGQNQGGSDDVGNCTEITHVDFSLASSTMAAQLPPPSKPPPPAEVMSHPIRVDTSPPVRRYTDTNNVIYEAEDRFYTSSAPSRDRRPDTYRASHF